jgi:hypothetical protein
MIYSCEEYVSTMQKTNSVAYSNEYSKTKNNTDSSNCFNFEKHSERTVKESAIEYSNVKGLIDNQVSKTRLENNLDNKYRLHDVQNKTRSKCNHEYVTRIILVIDTIRHYEVIEMARKIIIEVSKDTYEIIKRVGRMGESDEDVIRCGFSYLDKDSNFWNRE